MEFEIVEHVLGHVIGVLSVALMLVSLTNARHIIRVEAGMLLAAYLGYVGWRAMAV